VLDVDLQGVMNIKNSKLEAKYILITPPALDTLVGFTPFDCTFKTFSFFVCLQRKRLESRGTETKESIEKRLQIAEKDLEAGWL
jgi:guanylate kinase